MVNYCTKTGGSELDISTLDPISIKRKIKTHMLNPLHNLSFFFPTCCTHLLRKNLDSYVRGRIKIIVM